jgi:c-di-GMP-binding flagellar brake protein YcgR
MKKTPMKNKPAAQKSANKIPSAIEINRRREWRLDLPLTAEIEGSLPQGKKFREAIKLENISSGGAYFCMDSGVVVGSNLNLIIELPQKLTEGKKMRMRLKGIAVRLEKHDKKIKKHGVAVRFSKNFLVIPDKKKK